MLPLCLTVGLGGSAAFHRQLQVLGLKPYAVETFASAFMLLQQWSFDALVIDGDCDAGSLVQALPQLRNRTSAPIVVVSSDHGERRQIEILRMGATEVIVKPASPGLIGAKLHRLIEIARESVDTVDQERRSVVQIGPLRLDPRRAAASVGDAPLALTGREFELLLLLASRPGEFVHRDTIARTIRSPGGHGDGRRSADMHVYRIRRKLRDAGASALRLDTVYGRGYCLRVVHDESERGQWCA